MNDQDREQLLDEVRRLRGLLARQGAAEVGPFRQTPPWVFQVLATIDDGLLVLDRDWRFVYVNPQALRQAREPLTELLGRSLWEKYPELLGTPVEAHYRRAMAEQRAAHFETRGALSGRWLEVHAYPSPDGLLVYSRDVTERRRVEEALRDSEARLRGFFESSFEGIVIHRDGVILDANESFARLFGYPLAEVIGLPVLDLGAPECREEVRSRIESGDERPYEAVGLRKDGSTFPGELRGKAITYQGRPARVTVVRDISERKAAERKLQEYAGRLRTLSRRLLEVQEQERRHLARELHDEVGQALTGLKLTLDAARRLPAREAAAGLGGAEQLVQELTGTVRELSLRLRPSMLDDLGLLPALLWHLERYTAQTGVRVRFGHHGLVQRPPAEVETAAYRIVQEALTNVARHAGVAEARLHVAQEGGQLRVLVEDAGAGFDFEAVHRQGPSGGLSGMRERAVLLGGRLRVESSPGGGTRVAAELPLRSAEGPPLDGSA